MRGEEPLPYWRVLKGDPLQVGCRVDLLDAARRLRRRDCGTLRYLGAVAFATGRWAGIELDGTGAELGRNDGSVDGRRYFKCTASAGLFVRTEFCRHAIEGGCVSGGSGAAASADAANGVVPATPGRPAGASLWFGDDSYSD